MDRDTLIRVEIDDLVARGNKVCTAAERLLEAIVWDTEYDQAEALQKACQEWRKG